MSKNISERENFLMLLNGEKPEWIPNFGAVAKFTYNWGCDRVVDPVTGYFIDKFGVAFQLDKGPLGGFMPVNTVTQKFELEDIEDWESIMPKVDLGKIDWKEETEKMLAAGKIMYGSEAEEPVTNYVVGYLWDELHYMMGFEEALYSVAAEPEATAAFLNAMADFYIDCMHEQFKYHRPTMATIFDHVANKKGMLMSPDAYRAIIKPAQKKIIDALKEEGVVAQMHVDGYVDDIIADYAEIGVQVLQPAQVMNDLEMWKRDYGMIIEGGWDSFGPGNKENSTEEEVRQSVRTAMDAYGPSGKYAIWFSGASANPPERITWLNDEAAKYGREIYS